MQAHMRKHPISEPMLKDKETVEWRESFKDLLEETPAWALALKGYRCREGLTQNQLSELIGVAQSNISLMEKGKRAIGKKLAKKLAEVLHVDYHRFL